MDADLCLAVERLEALLISMRDQVDDLSERLEATSSELKLELAREYGHRRRLESELSAHLLEQRIQLLDFDLRRDCSEPSGPTSTACTACLPRRLSAE